jgi:hypothetical protein
MILKTSELQTKRLDFHIIPVKDLSPANLTIKFIAEILPSGQDDSLYICVLTYLSIAIYSILCFNVDFTD